MNTTNTETNTRSWITEFLDKTCDLLGYYITIYGSAQISIAYIKSQKINIGFDLPYIENDSNKFVLSYISMGTPSLINYIEENLYKIRNQIIVELHSLIDSEYKNKKPLLNFSGSMIDWSKKNNSNILHWSYTRHAISHNASLSELPLNDNESDILFLKQKILRGAPIKFEHENFIEFFNRDILQVIQVLDKQLNGEDSSVESRILPDETSLFFSMSKYDKSNNLIEENISPVYSNHYYMRGLVKALNLQNN